MDLRIETLDKPTLEKTIQFFYDRCTKGNRENHNIVCETVEFPDQPYRRKLRCRNCNKSVTINFFNNIQDLSRPINLKYDQLDYRFINTMIWKPMVNKYDIVVNWKNYATKSTYYPPKNIENYHYNKKLEYWEEK